MKQAPARMRHKSGPAEAFEADEAIGTPASANSSDLLLFTAERLYAEKGIDAVSMREISREAEQKNTSALHYHFGSKEALIRAILQRRMQEFDALRNVFLDQALQRDPRPSVRTAIEALVRPMATGLTERGKENYYNRFLAAAQMHPDVDIVAFTSDETNRGFRRAQAILEAALSGLPASLVRQRYLSGLAFIIFSLADFERIKARRGRQNRGFDMTRAVENLIDMAVGAVQAPVSEQVLARLRENSQA
ncbi:TetR/AcrR family transcriptional regulator [Cupriavidus nantongensis]|uniref:TetR/AcrR family transcriptional regulator n=1 Tax=Cupriavidus nantongensis TaxID=1796606 RepID=UPI0022462458|nr:TetR/AcrR family transcriptional regulator [Cupriavidus nantongensis]